MLCKKLELNSEYVLAIDTPKLALMGELWGVYCERLGEIWPCYKWNHTVIWKELSWVFLLILHVLLAHAGIILCMRPANERRCYNVTSSLIGWVHARNDPCPCICFPGDGKRGVRKEVSSGMPGKFFLPSVFGAWLKCLAARKWCQMVVIKNHFVLSSVSCYFSPWTCKKFFHHRLCLRCSTLHDTVDTILISW